MIIPTLLILNASIMQPIVSINIKKRASEVFAGVISPKPTVRIIVVAQ
jgi:hypothetical protein